MFSMFGLVDNRVGLATIMEIRRMEEETKKLPSGLVERKREISLSLLL